MNIIPEPPMQYSSFIFIQMMHSLFKFANNTKYISEFILCKNKIKIKREAIPYSSRYIELRTINDAISVIHRMRDEDHGRTICSCLIWLKIKDLQTRMLCSILSIYLLQIIYKLNFNFRCCFLLLILILFYFLTIKNTTKIGCVVFFNHVTWVDLSIGGGINQ